MWLTWFVVVVRHVYIFVCPACPAPIFVESLRNLNRVSLQLPVWLTGHKREMGKLSRSSIITDNVNWMPTGKGFRYTENSDAEDDYIFSPTETINHLLDGEWFRMSSMPPPITCYHQAAASGVVCWFKHCHWGHHHANLKIHHALNSFDRKTVWTLEDPLFLS